MSQSNPLHVSMPPALVDDLERLNPWWRGKPAPPIPSYRRWLFDRLHHLLKSGLTPAVALRGPRRVGKTVLVRQLIEQFLKEEIAGHRILYVPFDEIRRYGKLVDPILTIAYWFESNILGQTFNESAHANRIAYILLDEVQNLEAWAPQIKHLVDNQAVRVLLTGSSALRIEAGRDSLAGRITTLTIGTLLLREIAELRFMQSPSSLMPANGLDFFLQPTFWEEAKEKGKREREIRDQAYQAFSERGGYPIAHQNPDTPWPDLAALLNESIIKRAIQHDLRRGPRGQKRDEKLLERVFHLCCRYAGQTPGQATFVPEIHQAISPDIGWTRILNYVRFLDGTLLIRLIPPLEMRFRGQKSHPKICLCDHALRASWLQEVIPLDAAGLAANPHLTDLAGRLAESALGYFFASIPGLEVSYLPAKGIDPEVDFVLTVGTRRIPIEVKYRKQIDPHDDTHGLRAFLEKTIHNAPFGALVTLNDDVTVYDPRIITISLASLLWMR
jgi:predicted AAA+ superfamily ATPase